MGKLVMMVIPEGVAPWDEMSVEMNGQPYIVTVPAGAKSGDDCQVELRAAGTTNSAAEADLPLSPITRTSAPRSALEAAESSSNNNNNWQRWMRPDHNSLEASLQMRAQVALDLEAELARSQVSRAHTQAELQAAKGVVTTDDLDLEASLDVLVEECSHMVDGGMRQVVELCRRISADAASSALQDEKDESAEGRQTAAGWQDVFCKMTMIQAELKHLLDEEADPTSAPAQYHEAAPTRDGRNPHAWKRNYQPDSSVRGPVEADLQAARDASYAPNESFAAVADSFGAKDSKAHRLAGMWAAMGHLLAIMENMAMGRSDHKLQLRIDSNSVLSDMICGVLSALQSRIRRHSKPLKGPSSLAWELTDERNRAISDADGLREQLRASTDHVSEISRVNSSLQFEVNALRDQADQSGVVVCKVMQAEFGRVKAYCESLRLEKVSVEKELREVESRAAEADRQLDEAAEAVVEGEQNSRSAITYLEQELLKASCRAEAAESHSQPAERASNEALEQQLTPVEVQLSLVEEQLKDALTLADDKELQLQQQQQLLQLQTTHATDTAGSTAIEPRAPSGAVEVANMPTADRRVKSAEARAKASEKCAREAIKQARAADGRSTQLQKQLEEQVSGQCAVTSQEQTRTISYLEQEILKVSLRAEVAEAQLQGADVSSSPSIEADERIAEADASKLTLEAELRVLRACTTAQLEEQQVKHAADKHDALHEVRRQLESLSLANLDLTAQICTPKSATQLQDSSSSAAAETGVEISELRQMVGQLEMQKAEMALETAELMDRVSEQLEQLGDTNSLLQQRADDSDRIAEEAEAFIATEMAAVAEQYERDAQIVYDELQEELDESLQRIQALESEVVQWQQRTHDAGQVCASLKRGTAAVEDRAIEAEQRAKEAEEFCRRLKNSPLKRPIDKSALLRVQEADQRATEAEDRCVLLLDEQEGLVQLAVEAERKQLNLEQLFQGETERAEHQVETLVLALKEIQISQQSEASQYQAQQAQMVAAQQQISKLQAQITATEAAAESSEYLTAGLAGCSTGPESARGHPPSDQRAPLPEAQQKLVMNRASDRVELLRKQVAEKSQTAVSSHNRPMSRQEFFDCNESGEQVKHAADKHDALHEVLAAVRIQATERGRQGRLRASSKQGAASRTQPTKRARRVRSELKPRPAQSQGAPFSRAHLREAVSGALVAAEQSLREAAHQSPRTADARVGLVEERAASRSELGQAVGGGTQDAGSLIQTRVNWGVSPGVQRTIKAELARIQIKLTAQKDAEDKAEAEMAERRSLRTSNKRRLSASGLHKPMGMEVSDDLLKSWYR